MQQMNKKIVKYTLIFSLFCLFGLSLVIFHSQMIQVFIAVLDRLPYRLMGVS